MKSPMAFWMAALLVGSFSAGAAPLRLSELTRPGLAEKASSIPEFLTNKRKKVRALSSSSALVVELLVKFQSLDRVHVVEVDSADETAAMALLRQRRDVKFVEKNRRLKRQFVPSDPLLGEQWHHDTIQSRRAWDLDAGSHAVTVAIVDYPFNMNHPDLIANAVPGYDVNNDVPVYSGDDNHATFSAGMVAGVVDNGIGVAGAGNSRIMPINVTGYIAEMDAAIRWAADQGVRVVNLSWDGAGSAVLNEAGEYLREQTEGIVVMAGVNELGFLDYTNQPFITAVSMTDSADELRSKHGDHIDFSAPGWMVKSTTTSSYGVDSGTSFSAPLVSGILATLFSINPTLTAEQALSILRQTAVDLGDSGWDQRFGWGRVDFYHAVWLAAAQGATPPMLSNSIKQSGDDFVVSVEFHPGLIYTLLEKDSLTSTNWVVADAVAQSNEQLLEYRVSMESVTQAFYKVTGCLNL